MPPKAAAGAPEPSADVLILIHLIRTAPEFKPDMAEMARIFKISDKKNVPRKINTVLAPHGFKWLAGQIEEDGAPKDNDKGENGDEAVPKTPVKATKKAPKAPRSKEPKRPASNKKRKIDMEEKEEEPEDDDADMAKNEEDDMVGAISKDDEDETVHPATKDEDSTEED